jgi:hypothetical protein
MKIDKEQIIKWSNRLQSTDSIKERVELENRLVEFANKQIELRNDIHKKYRIRPIFSLVFSNLRFDCYNPVNNIISFRYDIECPNIHLELDMTLEEYEEKIKQEVIRDYTRKIDNYLTAIENWREFIKEIS